MIRLSALFTFLVTLSVSDSKYAVDDITTWLGYNISNIDSPAITALIDDCSNQLKNKGVFLIEDWITTSLSLFIQIELLSSTRISRESTRTIFQDYGDFVNFPSDAVRNYHLKNSIDFVPRGNIEDFVEGRMQTNPTLIKNKYRSHIFGLYNDPSLLNFIKKIVYKAYNDTNVYLSKDADGSVYGFVSNPNDWFSWHYDESPLSCVWLIKKPKDGGKFRWVNIDNPLKRQQASSGSEQESARIEYLWKTVGKVLELTDPKNVKNVKNAKDAEQKESDNNNNGGESEATTTGNEEDEEDEEEDIESMIHTLDAPENSMYCFFGNRTMHDITKVTSQDLRAVMVMTYVNDPHFQHSGNVRSLNDWSKKDKDKTEL